VWVFLAQGMCVGAIGTLAGLGCGLVLLHYRNPFREWLSATLHIQVFPPGIYEFEGIPGAGRALRRRLYLRGSIFDVFAGRPRACMGGRKAGPGQSTPCGLSPAANLAPRTPANPRRNGAVKEISFLRVFCHVETIQNFL